MSSIYGPLTVACEFSKIAENAPIPKPDLNTVLMKIAYLAPGEMDCFALKAGVPMAGTAVARGDEVEGI
jgi:hypothetical protein